MKGPFSKLSDPFTTFLIRCLVLLVLVNVALVGCESRLVSTLKWPPYDIVLIQSLDYTPKHSIRIFLLCTCRPNPGLEQCG